MNWTATVISDGGPSWDEGSTEGEITTITASRRRFRQEFKEGRPFDAVIDEGEELRSTSDHKRTVRPS